jgi:hypothetical protein
VQSPESEPQNYQKEKEKRKVQEKAIKVFY